MLTYSCFCDFVLFLCSAQLPHTEGPLEKPSDVTNMENANFVPQYPDQYPGPPIVTYGPYPGAVTDMAFPSPIHAPPPWIHRPGIPRGRRSEGLDPASVKHAFGKRERLGYILQTFFCVYSAILNNSHIRYQLRSYPKYRLINWFVAAQVEVPWYSGVTARLSRWEPGFESDCRPVLLSFSKTLYPHCCSRPRC